jgi:hypothetical protein
MPSILRPSMSGIAVNHMVNELNHISLTPLLRLSGETKTIKTGRLVLGLALAFTSAPVHAQTNTSWDGIWNGSWGGTTAAKIVIGGSKVLEYDYRGAPQKRIGETSVSDDKLSFGTPPGFIITLTKSGPTTASAHYHGPAGEADAMLTKQ